MSLLTFLKKPIIKAREDLRKQLMNKSVKDKNFTIVSNNCWGSELYRDMGLMYNTPFVAVIIYAPCYIKLLSNLKEYLESPLTFTNVSRYDLANEERKTRLYPIGLLKEDIEIHFYHIFNELEAKEKWNRRVKRINWENLFIVFCGEKCCTEEILEEFEKLDFPYKVCFTAKKYPRLKSTIAIKEYANNGASMYYISRKYFNVASWLNKESGDISFFEKLIGTLLYSLF